MSLNSILQLLLPKDKKIFPIFQEAVDNVQNMSEVLIKLVSTKDATERSMCLQHLEELEHKGDKITHTLIYELNSNFITPFDREDVHALASAIDDIADFMLAASTRIDLYGLTTYIHTAPELCENIKRSSVEIRNAVHSLNDLKKARAIQEHCTNIKRVEIQSDKIFNSGMAKLFESEKLPFELIRQKELITMLDTVIRKARYAAGIIEIIVVKYR